jgi:hypothetical protein
MSCISGLMYKLLFDFNILKKSINLRPEKIYLIIKISVILEKLYFGRFLWKM